MENQGRTKNSIRNIAFSYIGQIVNLIVKFALRTVFIYTLGKEYLGISGLFTNILSLLSLAELGIGTAITFCLYEPIAKHDEEKIAILMRIFKKAYTVIGIIVLVAGTSLTPFLNFFIKDMPDIPHISLIYLLFVFNSGISYFYSYKQTYIIANQKAYITTNNTYLMAFVAAIFQAVSLLAFKNYLLYLIIQVIFTFLANVRISRIADKMYPELAIRTDEQLDDNTKHLLLSNVGALVFHKIGALIVFSTDNLLLSKIFGIIIVGLYSNYTLIIQAVQSLENQFFNSITASIGNLGVDADSKHQEDVFFIIFFLDFVMSSCATVVLGSILDPFISLWAGSDYVMTIDCVIFIILNFYLTSMRQAAMTFDTAYGLAMYYKYMPIPESTINLVSSIIFAELFGPVGIFIGTTLSSLCTCIWIEPRVLFKYGLKDSGRKYLFIYLLYGGITVFMLVLSRFACGLIPLTGWSALILKALISVAIPVTFIVVIFSKSKEFLYLKVLFKKMIHRR